MKSKRVCALLLTAAMVVGTLAGCGGDDSGSTGTSSTPAATDSGDAGTSDAGSDSAASGEVIELTFFNADANQDDPWTDPVAEKLTEATGVKLKTSRPVGGNDQSEAVALMIAEENYPDMIFAKGSAGNLIDAGAMMDMTEMIEQYGPNIKKLYGEEFEKLKQSADDPAIYQLSAYNVGGTRFKDAGNMQIQWAALKAKDYQIPKNLDELEAMIKDYIAANPTTEDGLDRIGISLSTSDWHWLITLGNPADYSPLWAYAMPLEFTEIVTKLDEVSWSALIKCVTGKEADFDNNYDAMIAELEAAGMNEAEEMMTDGKRKCRLVCRSVCAALHNGKRVKTDDRHFRRAEKPMFQKRGGIFVGKMDVLGAGNRSSVS